MIISTISTWQLLDHVRSLEGDIAISEILVHVSADDRFDLFFLCVRAHGSGI